MKNGRKANGAAGLVERDAYGLRYSSVIIAALLKRRDAMGSNDRVDLAIETMGRIYDAVQKGGSEKNRNTYILDNVPVILAALLIRRSSTNPAELIAPAIATVNRIYDVVHEIDVPAEAMTSQPVSLYS